MTNSQSKRKWPCKSYTAKELSEYGGNGFRLYLSDVDRVDFGEMIFRTTAQKIPSWVQPNILTRCGLLFNTMICIISLLITPAIDGDFGEFASQWLPSILCIMMGILQILVAALDNWDGLVCHKYNQYLL